MDTSISKKKIKAYFWIIRPVNSITAFIAVIVAMILAVESPSSIDLLTYISIGSAAFFTTAQANTHNDIVDIEVDRINAPHRALPSGILTPKEAKIWAIFLFSMALLSGYIIDIRLALSWHFSLFWAFINSLLLDSYNQWFKKNGLFGNFIVGYVVGALFYYADIVVNEAFTFISLLGIYAQFMNWGREVIKGIRDIEGDRIGGVKTIGVLFGPKVSAIVGMILIDIGILATIPVILDGIQKNNLLIAMILIGLNGVLIIKTFQLIGDPTPEKATRMKKFLLYSMLAAVVSLIIGILFQ